MKKRLLAWILALVMLAALLPTTVLAEDAAVNPTYVYVTETGKLEDTVKNVYGGSYRADAVTALKLATADGAYLNAVDFAYLKKLPNLTYLDFEDADCVSVNNGKTYLHTIPDEALGTWGGSPASTSLKTVILSRKVNIMNSAAFYNCTNLEGEVLIPKNIKTMNWFLFGNTKVSKIVFEEGSQAETIGRGAFSNMPNLVSVNLPDTVEKIEDYAFQNSGNFKGNTGDGTMVLPASLKSLGEQALKNTGITKIVFNNAITAIGDSALQCPDLSGRVDIPGSVQEIKDQLLEACSKVEAVSLNEGTTTIAYNALANMAGLKAVYLPSTITSADDRAFRGQNAPVVFYLSSADPIAVIRNCYATPSAQRVGTYDMFAVTNGGIFPLATKFESGKLAAPVRDGYKFEGWYESEDFSGSAVTDASVGKTYYAKWTEDKDDSIYGQSKNVDLGIIAEGGSTSATVGFTGTIALDRAESDRGYFTANNSGMTVNITPVDGLKPGTYNDTIYVYTKTGATHFIYVTLTVTEKSADADQPQGDLPFWLPAAIGSNPFSDVAGGAYYNEAVRWAVKNGIASGTDAKHFSPDAACTRGQAGTFLWRAAGCPAPTLAENPFADVKPTDYCYDAVLWAVQTGVAKGTSRTTFSPDAPCTRGQIVTFLYRAAGSPSGYANSGYTDVPETSYCAAPVAWAVALRVTSGTSAITFSPDALCTRAQIVTFLYRANA